MNNTMMSYRRLWNVKGYARQCMAVHGSAWLCIAMHWLCSSVMLGYYQMMNDEAYLIKR